MEKPSVAILQMRARTLNSAPLAKKTPKGRFFLYTLSNLSIANCINLCKRYTHCESVSSKRRS